MTDEVEAYQPKEKLEQVYDHILEIKIDNERTRKILEFSEEEVESLDPYDAFVTFFQEMNGRAMTENEDNVIRTVINGERRWQNEAFEAYHVGIWFVCGKKCH